MQNTAFTPNLSGSATPGLEGAPRTRNHENRLRSVISAPKPESRASEEEGSPSKP